MSSQEEKYKTLTKTLDQKFLDHENGIEQVNWREERKHLEAAFKQLPGKLKEIYQKDYDTNLKAVNFAIEHPDLMF